MTQAPPQPAPQLAAQPTPLPAAPAGRQAAGGAPVTQPRPGAVASARRSLAGTPGRLWVLAVAGVLAGAVFGLLAGQSFRNAAAGIEHARANTDQMIRIQAINTNLVRADAQATNAFLLGGLEPAASRATYVDSIQAATTLIAQAARAQPADGDALAALNEQLVTYTSLVETARANNRQALPVGAQYLRNASNGLRADALPILDNLLQANVDRSEQEFDAIGTQRLWLGLGALVFLVVAGAGGYWLAVRTRRVFNVPLTAGAAAVVLMTIGGLVALGSVSDTVYDVRNQDFAASLATAQARIAAFDAKSQESLILINRGTACATSSAWNDASTTVKESSAAAEDAEDSARGLAAAWTPYVTAHAKICQLNDDGQWDQAVGFATGTTNTDSTEAFTAYDERSATVLTDASGSLGDRLAQAGGFLPYLGILGLLVGVLAAFGAGWGVSLRLAEYR